MLLSSLRLLLIATVSVVLLCCDDLNTPIPTLKQSVVCNLIAGATTQRVYLYRATSVDDPGPDYYSFLPITNDARFVPYVIAGGEVFVRDEMQSIIPFVFSIDSLYGTIVGKPYKNRETFIVQPGTRYYLSATTPFGRITGSTIVPGEFSILRPSPNEVFSKGATLIIQWTKSVNAFGYYVRVSDDHPRFPMTISTLLKDTTYSVNLNPDSGTTGQITIRVFAYDKNCDDHRSRGVSSAGIANANGCFGSSVLRTVSIRMQ